MWSAATIDGNDGTWLLFGDLRRGWIDTTDVVVVQRILAVLNNPRVAPDPPYPDAA